MLKQILYTSSFLPKSLNYAIGNLKSASERFQNRYEIYLNSIIVLLAESEHHFHRMKYAERRRSFLISIQRVNQRIGEQTDDSK